MASIDYNKLVAKLIPVRSISLGQTGFIRLGDKGKGLVRFLPTPPYVEAIQSQYQHIRKDMLERGELIDSIWFYVPESDIEYL